MPFQNQVLEKLLKGILQDRSIEFDSNLIDRSLIDKAVTYLPLTLSERQKDALYNAWQREISYIQGPPGTGKSYTIVSIMILALLLNKKVLFVSQKKAAIDVVRGKLEEFLGEKTVIYVGSESQERKQLQTYIDTKISEVCAYNFDNNFSRNKQEIDFLHQEIIDLEQNLTKYKNQLGDALNVENDFYRANNLYLKERNNFADIFGEDYTKQLDLRDKEIDDSGKAWFQRNIDKLRENLLSENLFRRKEFIYIRWFYKQCIDTLRADKIRFSRNEFGQIPLYLEFLFKVNNAYAKSRSIRRRISPSLSQIRTVIQQQEKILLDKKKQYIKQLIEYQFTEKLQQNQAVAGAFRRLLRWTNQNRVLESMDRIDYNKLRAISF